MEIYPLLKFLHVASVVVWVGAGFGLVILGIGADRAKDRAEFVRIVQNVVYLTPRVFIPVSLAVLVFGVITAYLMWDFSSLWINIGFVGWVATFSTGLFLIKPRADKVSALVAREGPSDAVVGLSREVLQIAKFDYVVLFAVIADMVFKPVAGDWPVLGLMALAILAAAYFFLVPTIMGRSAA